MIVWKTFLVSLLWGSAATLAILAFAWIVTGGEWMVIAVRGGIVASVVASVVYVMGSWNER